MGVLFECEAIRKDNPDASFTVWDTAPLWGVERLLALYGTDVANYTVKVSKVTTGTTGTTSSVDLLSAFDGADYLVDGDTGTPCADCGGPCNAADSVADESGLAWCGSFYGNGCADSKS